MDALRCGTIIFSILLGSELAFAQTPAPIYPTRPVRLIVPYAPGGGSDFVARIVQPALANALGQAIVIENRQGGAGIIGVEVVVRAEPNGYTLLLGNNSAVVIAPGLNPNSKVQPLRDLSPITKIANAPSVVVANPRFPPNSLKEFVAYAKANPGKVNYGSAGVGTVNWMEMESFRRAVGIDMVHIPYKGGAGPAMIGLASNDVQVMFTTLSGGANLIKQGRLKALAVMTANRVPIIPDVMTVTEAGYSGSGANSGAWQGIFAPKNTPPEIVQILFASAVKAMVAPEVGKRLAMGGVDVVTSKSPTEFFELVKTESENAKIIIKETGIVGNY